MKIYKYFTLTHTTITDKYDELIRSRNDNSL